MDPLPNVKSEVRPDLSKDDIARELAASVEGLFSVTYYRTVRSHKAQYRFMYLKPSKAIASALLIDREVLAVIADFPDVQVRTLHVVQELISRSKSRVEDKFALVVHGDPNGDERLRSWGRENGMVLVPLTRSRSSALPQKDRLRRHLSQELFATNSFQVTGPVVNDIDFFGRGNDAIEMLRQLESGRIRAIFGIRKVGKTSLINRVVRLARESGSSQVAMIDCSVKDFNSLSADEALKAVAKVSKMAATQGYAHIGDALKRTDKELLPVFQDLWEKQSTRSLIIVFDEVDYITPDSQTAKHWQLQFNDFWREFRVLVQEAQRHELTVAILVSGVSSKYFRVEEIAGVENSVLYFVPEQYLSPFARGASTAMLRDLGRRAGLRFSQGARDMIAAACGDFPFWIRMAGSHIHRSLDVESRPIEVDEQMATDLLEEFLVAEGADIARVAIENLQRVYPEQVELLKTCVAKGSLTAGEGRLLIRYGLACMEGDAAIVRSRMIEEGLKLVSTPVPPTPTDGTADETRRLRLGDGEWAEELAVLSRRVNLLERKMRAFVKYALKFDQSRDKHWIEAVLRGLPSDRRERLRPLAPDTIMEKLYWTDLSNIISKNWKVFERQIGDKQHFQLAMAQVNERPHAHAKDADLADIALYNRALDWLEERVVE